MQTLERLQHGIVVEPWQLKLAENNSLNSILLPLEEYMSTGLSSLTLLGEGNATINSEGEWLIFYGGAKNLSSKSFGIPFHQNDLVYLKEDFYPYQKKTVLKSQASCPEYEDFYSASIMPVEIAQYWLTVQGVYVLQMQDLGKIDNNVDYFITKNSPQWNKSNPKYPAERHQWVILLDLSSGKS
jgi:hypothetical protein